MTQTAMRSNYYYLVTALPDLALEEKKSAHSSLALMDDITDFISDEDLALLRLIRLPFDNANLINQLESRQRPFTAEGNFSAEELLHGIKAPDLLPGYMQQFIQAQKESRQLFPELSAEDQLNWLFYDAVTQHDNSFIAEWFTFELNLRNFLAGVTIKSGLHPDDSPEQGHARLLAASIICRNDVAEQIFKSTAPDFGLTPLLPWAEQIIEIAQGDMMGREKALDQLRWDTLDAYGLFSGFHIESILVFCLKLFIVERWQRLDPAEGRRRFELLVQEMKQGYSGKDAG